MPTTSRVEATNGKRKSKGYLVDLPSLTAAVCLSFAFESESGTRSALEEERQSQRG
jgi:predicted anti-sigma-YlaC factor YlaD